MCHVVINYIYFFDHLTATFERGQEIRAGGGGQDQEMINLSHM